MLAQIGIKVNLLAQTRAKYFPKILRRDTSFYMLGWTPATYDAHNALKALAQTRDGKDGVFNLGGYSNPKSTQSTSRSRSSSTRRSATSCCTRR